MTFSINKTGLLTTPLSARQTLQLASDEMHDLPRFMKAILDSSDVARSVFQDVHTPFMTKNLLVIGYGANLLAARVIERALATRGWRVRFSTPENAIPISGDTIICVSKAAVNDSVMRFRDQVAEQGYQVFLITSNEEASDSGLLLYSDTAPAGIPVSSIFAIIMLLDLVTTEDHKIERSKEKWNALIQRIQNNMLYLHDSVARKSSVVSQSQNICLIGSQSNARIASLLAWSITEFAGLPAITLSLEAGQDRPVPVLGERYDCMLILGDEPFLTDRYQSLSNRGVTIRPPRDVHGLGGAIYILLQGQLLAIEMTKTHHGIDNFAI